jgi:PKD repeat protein
MRRPRLTTLLAGAAAVLLISSCSDSTAPLITPDQEPPLEIAFDDPTCTATDVWWTFSDIPIVPDIDLIWLPAGHGNVTDAYQVLGGSRLVAQDEDRQDVIGRAYVHGQGSNWTVQLNMPIRGHMDVLHLVATVSMRPRDTAMVLDHEFSVSPPRTRGIFEAAAGQKVRVTGRIDRPGPDAMAQWTIGTAGTPAKINTCGIPTRGPNDWFKILGENGKCEGLTCSFWTTPMEGRDSRANKIQTWDWNIGNVTYREQHPIHPFTNLAEATTYEVKLTVTDMDGLTNPVTQPQYVICEDGMCRDAAIKRPLAEFVYECDGFECKFTDQSDPYGGPIASWFWEFGDGEATSVLQNPKHTFSETGKYRVSLTVTDAKGIYNTTSRDVPVTDVDEPGDITLTVVAYKLQGRKHADLTWSGAANVDIYRDGAFLITFSNASSYTHSTNERGGGSHVYQVCEVGTNTCSNEAVANY